MTEWAGPGEVIQGLEEIGPRPGLIRADHDTSWTQVEWWNLSDEKAVRWVIPGLWPWGHKPLLTGQPKVGKTSLVVELTAALLVDGHKFLGHFEPAALSQDDRRRGIILINAETPPGALVAELRRDLGDDQEARMCLDVLHLEAIGGAAMLDLTRPDLFDEWAHRLTSCNMCDRSDDWTPSVVIVDGLTAILQAADKGVEHYGLWYAKFRQLMIELRVPNALVVGHSTLTGNHSMGGTEALAGPDGLWTYSSDNVDNPRASRWFSVMPRLGGAVVPRMQVVRDDSGRLAHVGGVPTAVAGPIDGQPDDGPPDAVDAEGQVRSRLLAAGREGLSATQVTEGGRVGQERRRALAQMVERGVVIKRQDGRGFRCWLADLAPS